MDTDSTLILSLFPSLSVSLESNIVFDPMSLTAMFSNPPSSPSVNASNDPICGATAFSNNGYISDLFLGGFWNLCSLVRVRNCACVMVQSDSKGYRRCQIFFSKFSRDEFEILVAQKYNHNTNQMANSRYEYVKAFERENYLLPDTFIVIRVDGKGFHKFSQHYRFDKPNDLRALGVMNRAALKVMQKYSDVLMAYGDSDEYSFLLRRKCELYERREMKLCTLFASLMSTYYMFYWNLEFSEKSIEEDMVPTFDARAVVYPNFQVVRDYFSWRQVDCHINNLYNTAFWNLVKLGLTPQESEQRLMGTVSSDKNEILFKECGINYNNELEIFKKGTILVRELKDYTRKVDLSSRQKQREEKSRRKAEIKQYHVDIINDDSWWESRLWLNE